jgi:hypothetical protein
LGLRSSEAMFKSREGAWPRIGPAAYTGASRVRCSGRLPDERVIACATFADAFALGRQSRCPSQWQWRTQWRSMTARDPSEQAPQTMR